MGTGVRQKRSVVARKIHKWIGLLLGIQLVIWSLSGLYMVVVSIDIIHGDHLVRPAAPAPVAASELADPLPLAKGGDARLVSVEGRPAYAVDGGLVDARTGAPLPAPDEAAIRRIAQRRYAGTEPIRSAELLSDLPREVGGRTPPLWRVEFAHWNKPTFYLSPKTGELVSRRHELWRTFDFLWMLHIMDYDERENVNNLLLRAATVSAVAMALSGLWMLLYAFPARKKKGTAR